MTSASAGSQLSNLGGSASKRGNRFMLNLTGPGAHFTVVAAATVYESIRSTQSIWETREIAPNGLARAIVDAMRTLGIAWSAPFVLKCGDVGCSCSAPLRASLSCFGDAPKDRADALADLGAKGDLKHLIVLPLLSHGGEARSVVIIPAQSRCVRRLACRLGISGPARPLALPVVFP